MAERGELNTLTNPKDHKNRFRKVLCEFLFLARTQKSSPPPGPPRRAPQGALGLHNVDALLGGGADGAGQPPDDDVLVVGMDSFTTPSPGQRLFKKKPSF